MRMASVFGMLVVAGAAVARGVTTMTATPVSAVGCLAIAALTIVFVGKVVREIVRDGPGVDRDGPSVVRADWVRRK